MPTENDHPQGAEAGSDAPEAAESPSALAQGLPAVAPDLIEEIHADEIDNLVPARNYNQLPVVALGGSAGSIQALKNFFQVLPAETGMAYVVILHLSPDHPSTLPELLQATTAMPVRAARDAERVEANRVYVIPPGKHLLIVDGHLRLTNLDPQRGTRVAVDMFFRTLADTHGPQATAVVLSGADGDGSIGLKRIKERGGLTIAQDPEEAEQASMPSNAIDTGMVDWVLRVVNMPARIVEYRANGATLRLPPEDGPQPAKPALPPLDIDEAALREVLGFLRARTSHDFTYYKRATIVRRVSRRLQINGVPNLPDYVSFLRTHPGEAGALLQDLLISVTNFFRDRDTFAALEKDIIPSLFAGKGPEDTVRVWTAACATGEETYSLAMLLVEHARTLSHPPSIQVFGCDLDEEAFEHARAGVYTHAITADVSEERLARFFVKDARGYRVRRELREIVLFAEHDLLKDAPFSKLDLASCRNLLIYLNREAQDRALEIFHFALKPEGKLFLGSSESVPEENELFQTLDKKHRFYVRRTVQHVGLPVPTGTGTLQRVLQAREAPVLPSPIFSQTIATAFSPTSALPPSEERAALTELHFRFIERCAPPSVMLNERHDIVHLSEHAGRFMQPVGGLPTMNLLRSIHPDLRTELRGALFAVVETGAPVEVFGVPITLEGAARMVDLRVAPAPELAPSYLLVSFAARDPDPAASGSVPPRLETEAVVRHLEQEVEHVRGQLRDTVERYEASAEEYKSSHEELQSMNEELRSASEELETGREELQSINEELHTVNTQLKTNVDELGHANSDLHNLMNATNIITVFLDRELRITRFTPNAAEPFFLIPTDVGRPLAHVKQRLEYSECEADAEKVLRTLVPVEREVDGTDDQHWFLVRFQPYRTTEDHIGGLVLTFVDITERKRAEAERRRTEERLRLIVNSANDYAIFTLDLERRVTSWSPGAQIILGYTEAEILGQPGDIVFTPEDRAANAPVLETEKAKAEGHAENERYHLRRGGERFYGSGVTMALREDDGTIIGYVKIMRDLSEAKRTDDALRESEGRFRTLADAVPQVIWANDAEGKANYFNGRWFEYTGLSFKESANLGWQAIVHPDDAPASVEHWQRALAAGEVFDTDYRLRRADGVYRWHIGRNVPLKDEAGHVLGWFGSATDTEDLVHARAQAQAANAAKDHFLAVLSHELRTPLMPITMALASLGRRQDLPEVVSKAHAMIRRNVELETRFIDDMLDVTRIAQGKMEIVRRPMDLHESIERAVEVSSPDIEAKGQQLTVSLEAAEHTVSGDFARLQQVFWNLLKNASKFTPRGGAIHLRSRREGTDQVVEVTDTGIGMDSESLGRVFRPFEQANANITREFGGLGLGLAIAKGTVEAHGGTLRASSPGPGQGATFTVTLPTTTMLGAVEAAN